MEIEWKPAPLVPIPSTNFLAPHYVTAGDIFKAKTQRWRGKGNRFRRPSLIHRNVEGCNSKDCPCFEISPVVSANSC